MLPQRCSNACRYKDERQCLTRFCKISVFLVASAAIVEPMERPEANSRPLEHPTLSSMLLADVQRMDSEAWSRLVSTFGPIVYRWCRTSGVPESDSPDIVQDVFASVARGIAGFEREKREGSFRSWLATITRNKVRDYFRRCAKSGQAEGGTDALLRLQEHAESLDSTICTDAAESPVVRRVLEQVRAEFEPTTWQAFWMTVIDNKPTAEVAQTVGISTASVYQAKSRVLRRLRQNLSQLPE